MPREDGPDEWKRMARSPDPFTQSVAKALLELKRQKRDIELRYERPSFEAYLNYFRDKAQHNESLRILLDGIKNDEEKAVLFERAFT